jgi:hypothetical protein
MTGATLKGRMEMERKLLNFARLFPKTVARAMEEDAEVDVDEAKDRAPVYTGPPGPSKPIPYVLQDSIHAEPAEIRGNLISVEIVAGGEAGAYAIPQHEDMTLHHTIGQAKYIESVILESQSKKAGRVAARIDIGKMIL